MAPMKLITPLLILGLLLTACGAGGGMAELPTPQINVNSAPDAEGTAVAYLSAWNEGNYTAMYEMLTEASKQAISAQDFQDRYAMVATQTNLFRVDYEILSSLTNPRTAQVGYRVTLNSAVIGAVTRETSMNLELEGGLWRVMWEERIILPELAGGNTLSLERFVPTRGIIYDHNGDPIAANTGAVAVGVYPWAIVEGDESDVLSELARVSQRSVAEINELVFPEDREADYYVPIAEVSQEEFDARAGDWTELSGIYFYNYDTRLYFGGGAAPQTVGYYGPIPAEEVPNYIPLGYQSSDWIGRMGIERWGEEYLAGGRGGALYVLDPNGQVVTKLAETGAQPASSIVTTLDLDLQLRAQEAIRDFTGAIVVLERDTGRVLAMVSSPGFNQNWADPADANSFWDSYFPDDNQRFFNRAAQGQYAPGSIFKLITFSAGLESGLFHPESTLNCTQQWFGLSGIVLDNWTVEKELPADGELTYLQGLMRSCNIWYYQIGLDLYNAGMVDAVTEMARGFGLGSPTGIQEVAESSGSLSVPTTDDGDTGRSQAVQQAFGQGTTAITPLQAAVYAAAVGNGGTVFQPYLVDSVVDSNGVATLSFEPEVKGTLPTSEATLTNLQNAMRMVVADPRGTAQRQFSGFSVPVFGKTGTATAGEGVDPHAWFIGYTDAGRPDQADIAIAVLVENIGDGSEFAAPIWRRVASYYFFGAPDRLYPWESAFGVLDPIYFDETLQAEATSTAEAEEAIEVTPNP
ncbi:MAG TPA: penicillin-binding transpeptidase domain-containing protein [Anaerolineales bacterium]